MNSRRLAEYLTTVCQVGRLPGAPGTWGSLVALICWYLLPDNLTTPILAIALPLLFFLGVVAATVVERQHGVTDPGYIVIDEWVGQWLALLALPKALLPGLVAFGLFRLFDIAKPWPIKRLQRLPGGWGVMIDDVAAGLYALILAYLICRWWL